MMTKRIVCEISTTSNLKGLNELELKMQGESIKILLDDDSYWELENFTKRYE